MSHNTKKTNNKYRLWVVEKEEQNLEELNKEKKEGS